MEVEETKIHREEKEMDKISLPQTCFDMLSKEVALERVAGLEDLEHLKLANGEDGGSIKIYKGEKIEKVTMVEFKFNQEGVALPQHKNELGLGSQLFQIIPDFSYKIPIWGINGNIMKNGDFTFDTDLSFGFDLVMDYEFTMNYLDPFNDVYKKYWNHPDFKRVHLDDTTTWVRSYISPVFIIVETALDKANTVYDLCSEFIKLWVRIWKEAERKDETFKEAQKRRVISQYSGMKGTDRMAMILKKIYGEETFSKFFKAMT